MLITNFTIKAVGQFSGVHSENKAAVKYPSEYNFLENLHVLRKLIECFHLQRIHSSNNNFVLTVWDIIKYLWNCFLFLSSYGFRLVGKFEKLWNSRKTFIKNPVIICQRSQQQQNVCTIIKYVRIKVVPLELLLTAQLAVLSLQYSHSLRIWTFSIKFHNLFKSLWRSVLFQLTALFFFTPQGSAPLFVKSFFS